MLHRISWFVISWVENFGSSIMMICSCNVMCAIRLHGDSVGSMQEKEAEARQGDCMIEVINVEKRGGDHKTKAWDTGFENNKNNKVGSKKTYWCLQCRVLELETTTHCFCCEFLRLSVNLRCGASLLAINFLFPVPHTQPVEFGCLMLVSPKPCSNAYGEILHPLWWSDIEAGLPIYPQESQPKG